VPTHPPADEDAAIEVFKVLSNPVRLRIMRWLRDPEGEFAEYEPIADRREHGVCVTHIQAKSGLAQSTVSAYMAALESAGLVTAQRIGKYTHYRRDEERIAKLVGDLRDVI